MLDLSEVKKHYAGPGDVVKAVDGAQLSVGEGEFVAIFGPSGSGKTTFLLLAAGLLKPDDGTVTFRGKDLNDLSKQEILDYRREELGFIFQTFNLFPGLSALDNVAVPRMLAGAGYHEASDEAYSMLDLVGLTERAKHRPNQLSGGEQQRVSIARALAGRPSLILADEPTGNLDTKRGAEVLSLLGDLSRERDVAVVLVTHDIHAADHADSIREMRDGVLYDHNLEEELARNATRAEP